jgi:hypothetical protein
MTTPPAIIGGRFKSARIPLPLYGELLRSIPEILERQVPPKAIEDFDTGLREGRILRAELSKIVGKGLWITGRQAPLVAATVLSEALLNESIKRGFFMDANAFVESKKPEGDDEFAAKLDVDLLVIAGVGRLSEWGRSLIYHLTRSRYWDGLPTIIADSNPLMSDVVFEDAVNFVRITEDT